MSLKLAIHHIWTKALHTRVYYSDTYPNVFTNFKTYFNKYWQKYVFTSVD